MRLWTDPIAVAKEFLVPPERILHVTRQYVIREALYAIPFIGASCALFVASMFSMTSGSFVLGAMWLLLSIICAVAALNSLVRAFDNLFFVTTEKLIRTKRTSLFGHIVDPTHLDNVASAQSQNETWSLGKVGTVSVALKQSEQAGPILHVRHVVAADEIAAVIEKAVDLLRNRMYDDTTIEDQANQIAHIKKEAPAMGA